MMLPQITTDSPFGRALTEQARRANVIVEIGAGGGLGSTRCLMDGIEREDQTLYAVEANGENFQEMLNNMIANPKVDGQVRCFHGVVSNGIKPCFHPNPSLEVEAMWREELKAVTRSEENLLRNIPARIDLLLLDGGEFTTDGDFLALWHRSKVIALDDCHPGKSVKNVYAYSALLLTSFIVQEELEDRNGWAIFERP